MNPIKSFSELESHFALIASTRRVAVVCPSDDHTMEVVERCINNYKIQFTLCCAEPSAWADSLAAASEGNITVIYTSTPDEAARAAVSEVRQGRANVIMKGAVNTDNMLRAVLDRQNGLLEPGRILTHLTAAEMPAYHKLLFFADAAVIPQPDLAQMEAIIDYGTQVLRKLNINEPNTALIHFSEKSNEKFIHTMYYEELKHLNAEGRFGEGSTVEGPMDVKTACDRHSAEVKKIDSKVAGNADLLIFPNLVASNSFYKSISLFGHATMAGIICGANAPIVIPSRADSAQSKFYSLALACTAS